MNLKKRTLTNNRLFSLAAFVLCFITLVTGTQRTMASENDSTIPFTTNFYMDQCHFISHGKNMFFSLEPGYKRIYQGDEEGTTLDLEISVLNETKTFNLTFNATPQKIVTRIIEEREWEDGELTEVSRNYFALCRETNAIFYFGEDVDDYEGGQIVGHDGAWLAGQNGALPGIIMPGTYILGAKYSQEQAPGVAMDQAEHIQMGISVTTPAGPFNNCVKIKETSALDLEDESEKIYCPMVGMVVDDALELIAIEDNRASANASLNPCVVTFNPADNTLNIPCFDLGAQSFWLDLELTNFQKPFTFELDAFGLN